MNVVLLADLHGKFPGVLPEHDVLCLAGDILASNDIDKMEAWLVSVTDKPIFWIPGNHDVPLKGWCSRYHRIRCLHGNVIVVDGVKFGGFVWNNCSDSPEMAGFFAYCTPNMDKLRNEVARLKPCDVLVSHSPPAGILDTTHDGVSVGIPLLMEWAKASGCRHVLCGHVHEQGGKVYSDGSITVVNGACKIMSVKV